MSKVKEYIPVVVSETKGYKAVGSMCALGQECSIRPLNRSHVC